MTTTLTVRMTATQLAEFVFSLTDCPWEELLDGNVWIPFSSTDVPAIEAGCPVAFHDPGFGNEPWEGYAPSDIRRVTWWRPSMSDVTLEVTAVEDSFDVAYYFDLEAKSRETVDMLRRVLKMSTGIISCNGDPLTPAAADVMRELLVPESSSIDHNLVLKGE